MQISRFFPDKLLELDVECQSKEEVLQKIAETACRSSTLQQVSQKKVYKKLQKREDLSSTGFESKIAIPHCPIKGISDFVVGAIRTDEGVDFDAHDGLPTEIFIFIILPAEKRDEHIRLLSKLANALKEEENVEQLQKCTDKKSFRERLFSYIGEDFKQDKSKEYNLFNILIQEEELFDTVLHYVAEIEDCSITIIDTNNASKHLYKQPLFSEFWSGEEQKYSRMIKAVVNESFANDLIRRLNVLIDDQDSKDIAFWVQELFYFNGAVNL